MSKTSSMPYSRILLKLSGEALLGEMDYGIDPRVTTRIAQEIKELRALDIEIGLVIGGGNIFRGAGLASNGVDRVTGDHMGMLATIMNALSLQDALEKNGVFVRIMSALQVNQVCEAYIRRRAIRHLEKGRVVIFAAGTGNPFFTTDSAASLRGIEIGAQLVMKGTKVDGVYSDDPMTNPQAKLYTRLTYDEVITQKLNVMDTAAVVLCRDQGMPIRVFNMNKPGVMLDIVSGKDEGTLVA